MLLCFLSYQHCKKKRLLLKKLDNMKYFNIHKTFHKFFHKFFPNNKHGFVKKKIFIYNHVMLNLIIVSNTNHETNKPSKSKNKKSFVFLHGMGGNLFLWSKLINNYLLKIVETHPEYFFVFVDLPYHGASSNVLIDNYDKIDLYLEPIHALIKSVDTTEDACFVGHSFGGYIWLKMVEKYKNLKNNLVLLDPWMYLENSFPPYLLQANIMWYFVRIFFFLPEVLGVYIFKFLSSEYYSELDNELPLYFEYFYLQAFNTDFEYFEQLYKILQKEKFNITPYISRFDFVKNLKKLYISQNHLLFVNNSYTTFYDFVEPDKILNFDFKHSDFYINDNFLDNFVDYIIQK